MTEPGSRPGRFRDLGPRVGGGLALAAAAALAVWAGGPAAVIFVGLLLLLMLWELHRMVTGDARFAAPALVALAAAAVAAVLLTAMSGPAFAFLALLAAGWLAALLSPRGAAWLAGGAVYIGGAMCLLLGMRLSGETLVLVWLVLVVVAADVGAYFAGRRFGGRKLWPAVSPGKTWSGAFGGLAAAAAAGLVFALLAGWGPPSALAASLVLAVASQAGDLLESAVKRRFGVKDASQIIPGHGGMLDRLDGIAGATWAAALLGLLGGLGGHGA